MQHRISSFSVLRRSTGGWLAIAYGIILLLIGLYLAIGGAWLIALGGSWYYLFAGIGFVVAAIGFLMGAPWGIGILWLTTVLTWIWAVWEVGYDGWALMPRVVAPTVLALIALAFIGVLRRASRRTEAVVTVDRNAREPMAAPGATDAPIGAYRIGQHTKATASVVVAFVAIGAIGAVALHAGARDAHAAAAPSAAGQATADDMAASSDKDWTAWGGSNHALRYSDLKGIDRDNVAKLERVWTYRTGDLPHSKATKDKYSPETTPLKVGDRMFLCSAKDIVIALDAATGKEIWRYDPKVPDDAIPYGATCRGVAYYKDPQASSPREACAARIIEGTLDARLIAIDAESGKPCYDFGRAGTVDLSEGIGETVPGWYGNVAAPTIVRNIVVMGAQVQDGQAEDAPSGVIRGYDVMTGKLAWAWDMGRPDDTSAPPPGETYTRGTPNMWTSAAGDDKLGYVYVPLGNSSVDYFGGNRKDFENEFSSSLVAIDVTTGKPVWHFQTVHYDVWDYDLGSQPTLVDVRTSGGTVPAVVIPSKQGEIYVLDRRTGKSLFPVEERKAPSGGVEPTRLSPTQPYSGYHTVAKPDLTERDMWGITPLDQLACRIQFHRVSYQGRYTPPTTDRPYLEYPGYNGGSDWGSVAIDPARDIMIVNYNNMANFDRLLPRKEADKIGLAPINVPHKPIPPGRVEYAPQFGAPYANEIHPGWRLFTGMMCTQPPYGGIRAVQLSTGKTLWDEPLGQARANGPFGIPSMLPIRIGTPNNGGALVTAGGLVFIAAATDNLIRAIDIDTGKVLWSDKLPAGGQATPMAYEVDGREFIGFMAGGHHFMHTPPGDYVLAYALPTNGGKGSSTR